MANIEITKKYHFKDVQIVPKPTEIKSRAEVNLEVNYITKHSKRSINGVPVCIANMDTTGCLSMGEVKEDIFIAYHKYVDMNKLAEKLIEGIGTFREFVTVGIGDEELFRFKQLWTKVNDTANRFLTEQSVNIDIMMDVANGYMYSFLDQVKIYRNMFPRSIICAGNVCTPEGVENLIKAGVDIVKCGIANGGVCDTKNKAGVGMPQFSVAQECGQAANELGALCMSDGGIKTPADICKALAAGSHFVMAGSIFAGCDECEGEWEPDWECEQAKSNVKKYDLVIKGDHALGPGYECYIPPKKLKFYGMSSKVANDKYNGGLKDYRASEGKEIWVDYKGPLADTIRDIKGSLASCCSYCNTSNLENLKKNATFCLC